jgi:hypothetical protein
VPSVAVQIAKGEQTTHARPSLPRATPLTDRALSTGGAARLRRCWQ